MQQYWRSKSRTLVVHDYECGAHRPVPTTSLLVILSVVPQNIVARLLCVNCEVSRPTWYESTCQAYDVVQTHGTPGTPPVRLWLIDSICHCVCSSYQLLLNRQLLSWSTCHALILTDRSCGLAIRPSRPSP
jgi:hypothetical protein